MALNKPGCHNGGARIGNAAGVPVRMPHEKRASSGQALIAACVVVDLFVAGLVAASLVSSRVVFRAQAATSAENLARLLEAGISASFDQIDNALLAVADEYEKGVPIGSIDRAAFEAFLARQLSRAPVLFSLRTTDAQGMTRFNAPAMPMPVSLSDREYFRVLRDDPGAGLLVSPPAMGRIVSSPVMIFSRRLSAPDGSFAGVVNGAVPLVHLGEVLSQVDVGRGGVVTLRWEDLSLVAHKGAEGIHVELGDRSVSPQLRKLVNEGVAVATYDARSTLDGTERIFSIRRFARYPLYVVVGLGRSEYLAEWQRQSGRAVALLVSFVILTILSAAFVHRSWERHLESERLLRERGERLRESEERFRIAFQTSRDSVSLNRFEDGAFVAVNEGFTRMTGFGEEEALGRSPLDLGVWDDPSDRVRLRQALATEGFVDTLEARFRTKDGRVLHGLMSARLISAGGERFIFTITRDIGAWRRAEAERDHLGEQVRQAQKLESIGQLAGGVAHDFNNLLTVILSCTEALRADLAAGKAAGLEDVEQIEAAGARARDLVRQLLAFARKQVIAPVRLDLPEALKNCERLLRRVLREDIALRVRAEKGLWPIFCDPGQIEQVLLNLVVNARDAMPGGGTIEIVAQNLRVEGEAADRSSPDLVRLVVQDDGVGMPPEVKAHLFEPFFTTKGPGKGTGLGLATVHGIVTQSGGTIEVESAPGMGTRFEIRLPRTHLEAPGARSTSTLSPRGTETILLVEDNPLVRDVTVGALEGAGYRVLAASDGDAALGIVEAGSPRPDLLVTDVVMPGLGGRAVAEQLRRREPGIRVLFLSGYAPEAPFYAAELEPGMGFLAKPFTPTILLDRVRKLLDATPAFPLKTAKTA